MTNNDIGRLVLMDQPQTATEIYRKLRGIPPAARLTSAQKNERRRIAARLEELAGAGRIKRSVRHSDDVEIVEFSVFESTEVVSEFAAQ